MTGVVEPGAFVKIKGIISGETMLANRIKAQMRHGKGPDREDSGEADEGGDHESDGEDSGEADGEGDDESDGEHSGQADEGGGEESDGGGFRGGRREW